MQDVDSGDADDSGHADDSLAIHRFVSGVGELHERTALRTTHRRVWRGAQLLQRCLCSSADALGLSTTGVKVLELGAGTGWLGLNLAAALPTLELTLTELPVALPALKAQVERINGSFPGLRERVQVIELNWEDVQSSSAWHTRWDFVIGSDLTYSEDCLCALPRAMAALTGPATRTLLAHVPGRKAAVDAALHEEFAAAGLLLRALDWSDEPESARPALFAAPAPVAVGVGDEEEPGDWLPDGGLFGEEDAAYRALRPSPTVFEVVHLLGDRDT